MSDTNAVVRSRGNQSLYIFGVCLLTISYAVGLRWYIKRSKFSPIKERPVPLILTEITAMVVLTLTNSSLSILPYRIFSCFMIDLATETSCAVVVVTLTVRMFLMYLDNQITTMKKEYDSTLRDLNL